MSVKARLIKQLDNLVASAEEQTRLHISSRQKLYEALVATYLWWREANAVDGFLEEQYENHNIRARERDGEEKFTRVLRLVWRMDWNDTTPATLQQWSLALRNLHKQYEDNPQIYRSNAQAKLVALLADSGIRRFIGVEEKTELDDATVDDPRAGGKKAKQSKQATVDAQEIHSKHLGLAKSYFGQEAKPLASVVINAAVSTNKNSYALALVRQRADKTFEVLSTVSDETLLDEALVKSYKRNGKAAPEVLRLLADTVATQSLPIELEPHRYRLTDLSRDKDEEGKSIRQSKRLLFRARERDILLSNTRTGCSVVTCVKPNIFPIQATNDTFLNVNDRRYIEQAIVQDRNLNIFTASITNNEIPMADESRVASHRLVVENTVTGKVRSLYFYNLDVVDEKNKGQASIAAQDFPQPKWSCTADITDFSQINASFVHPWLREYGIRINRSKHKLIAIKFGRKGWRFKHYGESANFSHPSEIFGFGSNDADGAAFTALFQTKDLLPAISALDSIDIISPIQLAANSHYLVIGFKTDLAKVAVWIPTCDKRGRKDATAFVKSGGSHD